MAQLLQYYSRYQFLTAIMNVKVNMLTPNELLKQVSNVFPTHIRSDSSSVSAKVD
jgi:hypothetical protein